MAANPTRSDAPAPDARTGTRRESATLDVIPPQVERDDVEADGRVGAVAYPYRIYEASATVGRAFLSDREVTYVASVDRARRLVLRADVVPDVDSRDVADVLVLPADLPAELCRERAHDTVFEWTTRKFALASAPDITFERRVDARKLFWLAERDDGDVIVDSVTGDESRLEG
ncbi:hypothetical protein EFA46_011430 (plasmid) [Halarchaeum sp. CBA1220]|uniref:hypothetical protein n=1 Tax=Halarchaeum sp. CBA1220 TaxID=1853682 RepID=UPI000F3A8672|nr:hypothetical protein [Halarchaeum sp. CBA1220]QLC34866.1 hypothetical protein EFA46_011430 [Halarchaeum sp. CBA1220]